MSEPETGRAVPDTRDRLPLWVIVLLAVFLLLRVVELQGDWAAKNTRVSSLVGKADQKTMTQTLGSSITAKSVFVAPSSRPGTAGLDKTKLREALTAAETLQTSTGNSPRAARQTIILRGLLHLPIFGANGNSPDPQTAFRDAALADLPAADRSRLRAEGTLWAEVARGPHLSPAQTLAYAVQLRAIPNLRWWRFPALAVLYGSQGNVKAADHYLQQSTTQALLSVVPFGLLGLLEMLLGLAGIGLLAYLTLRYFRGSAVSGPDLWPTMREIVPLTERRLRAGDLMGVFVLYLLMQDIIGWLVAGFGRPHHGLYFAGLLAPYRAELVTLPSESRVAVIVVLEFFAYLLGALVPVAVLIGIARHKGASIAEELGWNTHRLGWNLLYGVGGYAIALPFLLVATGIGSHIHAPAPSNPAIPLLANISTLWVQLLMASLLTIAAPLTEEFLFRGVFYNAAKLRVGVWPAIVLTGLIFGFVHPVGIAEMLPLAVLGGVFAWMAETRKSLVPSMVGHFLQNSLATLMLLLALGG